MSDSQTITIVEQQEGDVSPNAGRAYVAIEAQRLLSGERILSDSAGVRGLIDELSARGIFEDSISIAGVRAEVRKGMLEDDNAAGYTVCVECDDTSLAPALLAVVASQDACELIRMEWSYNDDEKVKEWLEACVERARGMADAAAGALGVKVKGVQNLAVETLEEESFSVAASDDSDAKKKTTTETLVPTRRMAVLVEATFLVG